MVDGDGENTIDFINKVYKEDGIKGLELINSIFNPNGWEDYGFETLSTEITSVKQKYESIKKRKKNASRL